MTFLILVLENISWNFYPFEHSIWGNARICSQTGHLYLTYPFDLTLCFCVKHNIVNGYHKGFRVLPSSSLVMKLLEVQVALVSLDFINGMLISILFSSSFGIFDIWILHGEGGLISWLQTSFVEDYCQFHYSNMYVFRMDVFTAIFQLLGIRHLYIAIQMWPHFDDY